MQNVELSGIYSDLVQNRAITIGFAALIAEKTGVNENTVRAFLNGNNRVYIGEEAKCKVKKAAFQILSEKADHIRNAAESLNKLLAEPAK